MSNKSQVEAQVIHTDGNRYKEIHDERSVSVTLELSFAPYCLGSTRFQLIIVITLQNSTSTILDIQRSKHWEDHYKTRSIPGKNLRRRKSLRAWREPVWWRRKYRRKRADNGRSVVEIAQNVHQVEGTPVVEQFPHPKLLKVTNTANSRLWHHGIQFNLELTIIQDFVEWSEILFWYSRPVEIDKCNGVSQRRRIWMIRQSAHKLPDVKTTTDFFLLQVSASLGLVQLDSRSGDANKNKYSWTFRQKCFGYHR